MAKVLLAEDDQTMVGLLMTLLRMEGYEVQAIDADADVPAAVERERPQVLVLDVHLSHQNGLDVLDKIRKADKPRRVHVIMISGLNVKEESIKRGADNFLLKPFMPDDLMAMLRKGVGAG